MIIIRFRSTAISIIPNIHNKPRSAKPKTNPIPHNFKKKNETPKPNPNKYETPTTQLHEIR